MAALILAHRAFYCHIDLALGRLPNNLWKHHPLPAPLGELDRPGLEGQRSSSAMTSGEETGDQLMSTHMFRPLAGCVLITMNLGFGTQVIDLSLDVQSQCLVV